MAWTNIHPCTYNISHRLEIRPGRSLAKQEDRKALKNMVSGGNAYLWIFDLLYSGRKLSCHRLARQDLPHWHTPFYADIYNYTQVQCTYKRAPNICLPLAGILRALLLFILLNLFRCHGSLLFTQTFSFEFRVVIPSPSTPPHGTQILNHLCALRVFLHVQLNLFVYYFPVFMI